MTTLLYAPLFFIKTLIKTLWLSVTSLKFYADVFTSYKGYGIKYIFTLACISSFICCIILLSYVNRTNDYLNNAVAYETTTNMEHILQQLPVIHYDGQKITIPDGNSVLIPINNANVIAIDPTGKFAKNDKAQIPIIFSESKIIINLINSENKVVESVELNYQNLFGKEPQIFTTEILEKKLTEIFDKAPLLIIYTLMPIIVLISFFNSLLAQSYVIILLYLISFLISIKPSLKTCIRMSLFAGGITALFQSIFSLVYYMDILRYIQFWANFLMILGLLKMSNKVKLPFLK